MAKREKSVFNTSEVPHLWAHRTQNSARNSQGNLYFENETIYSYNGNFPIARHVTGKKKNSHAILITTGRYSRTTNRHVSAVHSSIPSYVPVFRVYLPSDTPGNYLQEYISSVETLAEMARERRTEVTRNRDVQEARVWAAECKAFCKFFGLKIPKLAALPKINRKKLEKQSKTIADARDSKSVKRRTHSHCPCAARTPFCSCSHGGGARIRSHSQRPHASLGPLCHRQSRR